MYTVVLLSFFSVHCNALLMLSQHGPVAGSLRERRKILLSAAGGAEDGESEDALDWDEALKALRQRQVDAAAADNVAFADSESEGLQPRPPINEDAFPPPTNPSSLPSAGGDWLRSPNGGASNAGSSPSGFRFDGQRGGPKKQEAFVAGLDERDEKLLRAAYLYGGRALTLITLSSLILFIYVGVTGGITDGFDRFSEPVETMQETIAREGMDVFQQF